MKIKIVFFILLIFSSYLNASSSLTGNGYDGQEPINSFSFPQQINLSKVPSSYENVNQSYIRNALANINCFRDNFNKDLYIANLSSIDLYTGYYTCKYYLVDSPNTLSSVKTYKNEIAEEENRYFYNKTQTPISELQFPTFRNYYGDYTLKEQYNTFSKSVYKIDLELIKNEFIDLLELIKDNEHDFSSVDFVQSEKIDSHSYYKQTTSAAFSGLITLDRDYFNEGFMVDNSGDANLKDFALINDKNYDVNNHEESLILSDWYKKARDLNSYEKSANVLTVFSFIDKKLWGFYIYIMQNIRDAYLYIIYTLLFLGLIIKAITTYSNVKNEKIKGKQVGYLAGGYIALALAFNAPINADHISLPKKFIYLDSTELNLSNEQLEARKSFLSTSTLVQSVVRYSAEWGTVSANILSDYLYFGYLKYLESMSNFYNTDDLESIKLDLINLHKDSYILYKNSLFFNNICVPLYKNELLHYRPSEEVISSSVAKNKQTDAFKSLGINEIEFSTCTKINSDLKAQTAFNLASYQNLRKKIRKIKILIDNETDTEFSEKKTGFNEAISVLSFSQSKNGWINVSSAPVTYNFLVENSAFSNSYIEEKLNEEFKDRNIVDAYYNEEDKLNDINNSEIAETSFNLLNSVSAYFVLPGFANSFLKLYDSLSSKIIGIKIQEFIPERVRESKITKKSLRTINKLKNVAKKMIFKLPYLNKIKILDSFLDKAKTISMHILLLSISYIIVLSLYMTIITSATIIIVALAITFRIVFYYIELLLFYFVSDAVAFAAIISGSAIKILSHFFMKLLVAVVLGPSLITLSVYVYIFSLGLAKELYLMLIGNLYDILIVMNSEIVGKQASGYTWFNGYFQEIAFQFKISAFKGIGMILLELFGIFFAVIVLLMFKKWLLDILGYQNTQEIADSVTDQVQGKLTQFTGPIK